jgi:hypothetical protein
LRRIRRIIAAISAANNLRMRQMRPIITAWKTVITSGKPAIGRTGDSTWPF